jgi:hypothetical protein
MHGLQWDYSLPRSPHGEVSWTRNRKILTSSYLRKTWRQRILLPEKNKKSTVTAFIEKKSRRLLLSSQRKVDGQCFRIYNVDHVFSQDNNKATHFPLRKRGDGYALRKLKPKTKRVVFERRSLHFDNQALTTTLSNERRSDCSLSGSQKQFATLIRNLPNVTQPGAWDRNVFR